ncbi:g4793 [Coccomyxa viridis]|uniref:G4793 protein n=1 Tax=Coccomyxa viridis TaxID=1274662 RepID=A0ABP1FSM4_9CHLO
MAPKRLVYKSRVFEIECVDMSNEEIMTHLNDRLHLPQGAYVRLRKRAGSSNPEVWEASVEGLAPGVESPLTRLVHDQDQELVAALQAALAEQQQAHEVLMEQANAQKDEALADNAELREALALSEQQRQRVTVLAVTGKVMRQRAMVVRAKMWYVIVTFPLRPFDARWPTTVAAYRDWDNYRPAGSQQEKQMMLVEWQYRPGVISKLTYMGGHSPHREGNGIAHHIGQEHLAAVTCFDPAEREDYTTIWHLARHEQQFAVTTRANGGPDFDAMFRGAGQ